MPELVIHKQTKRHLAALGKQQPHAVLISGPIGIGKMAIAKTLATGLLGIDPDKLSQYPYLRQISSESKKSIGIEDVRELEHFLALKIPGSKTVSRLVIIEDAHMLTLEAQNALLKTLEEPPSGTVVVLTTAHEHALLPTIRSRVQTLQVKKPPLQELKGFFGSSASEGAVNQAVAISGGLPGLMAALIGEDTGHPLAAAVSYARQLLQKTAYERLLLVDELSKQKDLAHDVCYILGQMAQAALAKDGTSERWKSIMQAAYEAESQLLRSGQPKLVMTNLMIRL
jgi:DNA polymerase III subunit delta'